MSKLLILQGLPASGKSTYAKQLLAEYGDRAIRINNDDLSEMLFGSSFTPNNKIAPKLLADLRRSIITRSVRRNVDLIIVDNTNLSSATVEDLIALADILEIPFEINRSFLEISLDECLRRNSLRANPVPEEVIRRMDRTRDYK